MAFRVLIKHCSLPLHFHGSSCRLHLLKAPIGTTNATSKLKSYICRHFRTNSIGNAFSKCKPKWRFVALVPAGCLLSGLRRNICSSGVHCEHSPQLSLEAHLKYRKQEEHQSIIFKLWSLFRYLMRCLHIVCVFIPLVCVYPLFAISESTRYAWLCTTRASFEHLGPTFIKLGQWAATRRDLFPAQFCMVFSKLHSSSKAHSWTLTKRKLRKAFGPKWRELFIHINKKPVGSGCIAQVYQAYMKVNTLPDGHIPDDLDTNPHEIDFMDGLEVVGFNMLLDQLSSMWEGTMTHAQDLHDSMHNSSPASSFPSPVVEYMNKNQLCDSDVLPVAIKVLHPGIYRQVSRDLRILHLLSRIGEVIIPSLKWISLSECVKEFENVLVRQIDLRFEAECLEQFRHNFRDIPSVHFPQPILPYCKRNVLVETFEKGQPISDFLQTQHDGSEIKEELATYSVNALLQMIFTHNLVHGDLHPGNIIVQNAEDFTQKQEETRLVEVDVMDTVVLGVTPAADSSPLRLVILDTGITASLDPQSLINFRDVFTAVLLDQGDKIAQMMLDRARYHECNDLVNYRREMYELVHKFRQDTLSLRKVQVGDLLQQVFNIMTRYKVMMDHAFASILLSIFVLEGLGRSLDPNLDLIEKAKPILLGSSTKL